MVILHIALTIGSLLLQGTSFNIEVCQYSLQGHHTLLKYDGCQMKPKTLSTSWQLDGVLLQTVMLFCLPSFLVTHDMTLEIVKACFGTCTMDFKCARQKLSIFPKKLILHPEHCDKNLE